MAKRKKKEKESEYTTGFITDAGNMFSEDDLKRYEVPQSKQIEDEARFSVGVIAPPYNLSKLMEWLHFSVIHASCVHAKVKDTVGVGWQLRKIEGKKPTNQETETLKNFFKKVNEKEDIISVCKKVMLDYEGCGNGYFEIVRGNSQESIKALYHVNATTIRLTPGREKWVQQISTHKVFFKNWGDERILNKNTGRFVKTIRPEEAANEIIQTRQYTHKSAYYGLPDWLPALYQMYGEMKEKEYNLDFFTNFGIPAYAVIMEGGKFDEETEELIQQYFRTEVKQNPHKTLVFNSPKGTLRFEKLSVETKEASFRIYRKDNRDDVLTAHHVPPYRASIVEKGQLGGTVAEDVDRIYLDSVINPRQKEFTWIINELIINEGFGIETLAFEFQDIDIRDRKTQVEIDEKYFKMGARTANQMLIAQGKEPYAGGDVYYVPGNLVPIGEAELKLAKVKTNADNAENKKPGVDSRPDEDKLAGQDYSAVNENEAGPDSG